MKKLVISVGNPLKSDDNVGNVVLEELKKVLKGVYFIKGCTNPENFIYLIQQINPDLIFFIDVAFFDGKVGEVKIFQLEEILNMSLSTHNFSVKAFKKFFPKSKIFLVGIKPKNLEIGEDLSPELKRKLGSIIEKVKNKIEETT